MNKIKNTSPQWEKEIEIDGLYTKTSEGKYNKLVFRNHTYNFTLPKEGWVEAADGSATNLVTISGLEADIPGILGLQNGISKTIYKAAINSALAVWAQNGNEITIKAFRGKPAIKNAQGETEIVDVPCIITTCYSKGASFNNSGTSTNIEGRENDSLVQTATQNPESTADPSNIVEGRGNSAFGRYNKIYGQQNTALNYNNRIGEENQEDVKNSLVVNHGNILKPGTSNSFMAGLYNESTDRAVPQFIIGYVGGNETETEVNTGQRALFAVGSGYVTDDSSGTRTYHRRNAFVVNETVYDSQNNPTHSVYLGQTKLTEANLIELLNLIGIDSNLDSIIAKEEELIGGFEA